MESQLQHTHGRHFDEHDTLTSVGQHNEDEHHGEKKSVIKKVKEKAKKLKNTITKHGHGGHEYHHHEHEDDDDDDEETVEDPEVHGAPMYDSARVGHGGPDANLAQPRGNLERPSVMAEDRYSKPVASHCVQPHVSSTGAYGTGLSEPSGPSGLGHNQGYGQEVNPENWRGRIGHSTGITDPIYGAGHVADPVVSHGGGGKVVNQGGSRGTLGKSTGMVPDPQAPKDPSTLHSDPSNYATKVTNPTHKTSKEAELSQLQHSLDKIGIDSEPKTLDHNRPENLPHETLTGNPSSQTSTYASAIIDKATSAKDAIASKLGYSGQTPTTESHEGSGSAADYAHAITDKVTGTLAPVYEKVVDAGSSVISKVQGSMAGTAQPQADTGSHPVVTDKGVSVKEHLVETLRPGDEDKALSEVITHALHRDDRRLGTVTESVEVRQRLGPDRHEGHQHDGSGNVVADKSVADRVKDAVGSWFGGEGDAPQGTLGTSYVTDKGLSSNPTGDQNRGKGKE